MLTSRLPSLLVGILLCSWSGIGILRLAERDLRLPLAPAAPAAALAPRCYHVTWGAVDSLYLGYRPQVSEPRLPTELNLELDTPSGGYTDYTDSWRTLRLGPQSANGNRLLGTDVPQVWRSAGPDSIDAVLMGFPMTVRLRFPAGGTRVRARAVVTWDTPGTVVSEIVLTVVGCPSTPAR
jgi:hypothetical protein